MPASANDDTAQVPLAIQTLLAREALAVMAGIMYYSYILSCVFLWLREILIMFIVSIAILLAVAGWCVRLIRHLGKRAT